MADLRIGLLAGAVPVILAIVGAVAVSRGAAATPPLVAPKILDISEWNGEIDPARMAQEDVSAVVVRASHGTTADSRVLENVAALKAANVPVAALYHDFDPAADWLAQLELFAGIMRQTDVERGALWVMADEWTVEQAGAAQHFMSGLSNAFPLPFGYRHLIYTDVATWQDMGQPAWGSRYELWLTNDPNDLLGVDPTLPAPWRTWRLWQYTVAGDGPANGVSSFQVGISRFNGSTLQFEGWLKLARVRGGQR